MGPNLLRLRTLPLVGRRHERDLLWKSLREVALHRKPRVVLLAGRAGSGKSRLAQWLVERAHETGAAVIFKAFHPSIPGGTEALARMVARHFGCIGLPRPKVLARIERALQVTGVKHPDEAQALTELVTPEETTAEGPFASLTRRYLLVARVLERAAHARPALLWLDDVQWGSDTLGFVDFLLRHPAAPEFPCLLLLTLQEEALADHPFEAAQLEKLRGDDRCTTLAVPPLPPADHLRLIEQMVEGDLALRIAERTAGNPMFAVELVIALVQRGLLKPAARGFVLKAGATLELPDDLYQVWRTRIDRFLDGEPPQVRTALELAATLGLEVEREVWERVARSARISLPPNLEDRLVSEGLAEFTETGWAFVHAMLRETLERQAREGGRWPALNRLCARTFASAGPLRMPDRNERLGRHLFEGGEREAALDPLWKGSLQRLYRSDYRSALCLLLLREKALEELGIPRNDPRWLEGWCLRTRIHELQGELEEVRHWTRWIRKAARPGQDDRFVAEALRALGNAERQAGDLRQALLFLEAAGKIFEATGDRISLAKILASSGDVARQQGDLKGAEQFFRRALALHREAQNTLGVATVCAGLGNVARQMGRLQEAAALFEEAHALFEQLGNQIGIANCLNGLAETARAQGDFEAAESGYRKAFEIYETIGSRNAIVMQINLALLLLAQRRFSEAKAILRDTLDRSGKRPPQGLLACLHLALLPCAAAEGAWDAWDEHDHAARTLLEKTGLIDPDIAWSLELAGDLALAAGEGERARQAYALARWQWEQLGDSEKSEVLDRKIWGGRGSGGTPV
ncbi:MAG: tetratricopeptide repeat protein [Deltaproteobacteria bacterium]|nr:MAG: tetratricopeptide repeat protein [Deltaproteobacteria bacterium]